MGENVSQVGEAGLLLRTQLFGTGCTTATGQQLAPRLRLKVEWLDANRSRRLPIGATDVPLTDTNDSGIVLDCAWPLAFNLRNSSKGTLGYISEWRGLGGLNLAQDIVLWSPAPGAHSPLPPTLRKQSGGGTVADQIRCVAVLEKLSYGGGPADPIRISAYVSKDNQVKLRYKLVRDLPSHKLKLDYAVVGFDEDAKSWYPAVELLTTPSDAQLNTRDGELQIFMAFEPTRIDEQLDINVYRMVFEIIPGKKKTRLKLATGPEHRYVSEWQGEE